MHRGGEWYNVNWEFPKTKLFQKEVNVRKKIFSIWSVLLVLVVSIAVLVPGCEPVQCTIEVKATLDGAAWSGNVSYTLTGPTSNTTGTSVSDTFSVDCGNWTCAYVSGGPAGASFVNITPLPTQSVSNGGTIAFTLNFVLPQVPQWDASIEFKTWTIDGVPVPPGTYQVPPDTIIDIEYEEHVSGEEDAVVTVHQTNWLRFHYMGPGEWVTIHAVNAWGAVKMSPPADKLSQMTTHAGNPAPYCTYIEVLKCEPVLLDVETVWEQVVCVDYTKSINWLHFWELDGAEVLFDVIPPQEPLPEGGTFNLTAMACVEMEGDENPDNDCTDWCPPLIIIVGPQQPQ